MQHEYSIVIGRYQPFSNVHQNILKLALELGRNVIVILGSDSKAPDPHDPFTAEERKQLVSSTLSENELRRVVFLPIRDYLYNETTWVIDVQQKVYDITNHSDNVCLVGHKSDLTSYYLDSFPEWKFIDYKPNHPFHATEIRSLYFTHDAAYKQYVPASVSAWMEDFKKHHRFAQLKASFDELREYHALWEGAPFKPTFQTVDCVCIKSGHLLVVRRRGKYGGGLLALPGGFVDPNETLRESAIRELKEETQIALPKKELYAAIRGERTFDHPRRSLRGRTITQAFKLNLGVGALPRVKGDSDADKAFWMPLSEFYANSDLFFEDHWHIVFSMLHRDDDNV